MLQTPPPISNMHIAHLICGRPAQTLVDVHGDYGHVVSVWLKESYKNVNDFFILDSFNAFESKLPAEDQLDQYKAIVLSGSAASAYEDVDWINNLVAFVARVAQTRPSIKLIGICFGHQIIARALGGQVVRNHGRWEIGPTPISLTDLGKAIFGVDSFHIQQMHQDHVPSVPESFYLLGSTPVSVNQGMVRFRDGKAAPSPDDVNADDIHILALQGHPEFTEPLVTDLVKQRSAKGIIDKQIKDDYMQKRRFWQNDGVGIIGRAIWNVIGI
ncbi:hypothetical protein APHAL10511_005164 [Amanita phalloides]|nr:hypothetical protein APHAL10511_005164 [Amanita phalloides]